MIAQIAIIVRRGVSLAAMSHVLCDMAQIMTVNGAISTLAHVIHTMFPTLKLSLLNSAIQLREQVVTSHLRHVILLTMLQRGIAKGK
jgi:hypothetical protein